MEFNLMTHQRRIYTTNIQLSQGESDVISDLNKNACSRVCPLDQKILLINGDNKGF